MLVPPCIESPYRRYQHFCNLYCFWLKSDLKFIFKIFVWFDEKLFKKKCLAYKILKKVVRTKNICFKCGNYVSGTIWAPCMKPSEPRITMQPETGVILTTGPTCKLWYKPPPWINISLITIIIVRPYSHIYM